VAIVRKETCAWAATAYLCHWRCIQCLLAVHAWTYLRGTSHLDVKYALGHNAGMPYKIATGTQCINAGDWK
jgi:hypothetical protein